jgi:protoheme IX farnesyltransferase
VTASVARSAGEPVARSYGERVRSYVALTKPRVIELLLVTAVPPMFVAAHGVPGIAAVAATVVGGALAAGGASAINAYLERDLDALMRRTARRPLPCHEVSPGNAFAFGVALNVVAFVILLVGANLLAATLTMVASLFYIFVYTIWLKPRTPQSIVIGGAAGAIPVLVGWAAVRNDVSITAVLLAVVVFLWTPAHFWSLAIKYSDDYAAAGVPMLPVVRGVAVAAREIVWYSIATVIASALVIAGGQVGIVYSGSALVLGVLFVGVARTLVADPTPNRALRVFVTSNTYLTLLFAVLIVDALVTR